MFVFFIIVYDYDFRSFNPYCISHHLIILQKVMCVHTHTLQPF